mmetsp:Transcript_28889/g.72026  ORF Transcript_28889/g.72026 Transcript_28889/m.72026 type:complete len:232 (+) Transcript_28889:167-862(+)
MTTVGMSDLFSTYQEDFDRLIVEVEGKLKILNNYEDSTSDLRQAIADCQKFIQQAEQNLRQMEMECRTLPASTAPHIAESMASRRTNLTELSQEFQNARTDLERKALLGQRGGRGGAFEMNGLGSGSHEHRQRLLDARNGLRQGVDQLEESRRLALETEQIGGEILGDLRSQRETILRTRHNLSDVSYNLDWARRTIANMGRRVVANKILLYSIIGVCVLAIIFIIYWKFA